MATHSSILAWRIPWIEEPGGLQSMGSLGADMTERLHFHFSLSCIGERNGSPLQYSCLKNSRDGGAWWAAVSEVTQSWTQLRWLSSSSNKLVIIMEHNPFWVRHFNSYFSVKEVVKFFPKEFCTHYEFRCIFCLLKFNLHNLKISFLLFSFPHFFLFLSIWQYLNSLESFNSETAMDNLSLILFKIHIQNLLFLFLFVNYGSF